MRWAPRFVRPAVAMVRSPERRSRLRVESLEGREVPTVTGTAYIDQNLNGSMDVEDVGVAGVTVTATDPTGVTQTTTTAADGTYTLATNAPNLRIEFSNLPPNTLPGRVTDSSGPLVRFLTANSPRTGVDLALDAPQLVTTQFYYDDAENGENSDEGAILSVPYGADSSITPNTLANVADVGSVWGLAYQPSSDTLYASSFLKAHAGLGPNAAGTGTTTGGIYAIDPTGTNPPSLLIDLNTAGAGLGTGADPHPTQTDSDGGDWYHDAATLPLVGKRGLGGLAISADGKTLYTINLNTRELIEIPLNVNGTRDTTRAIRHTPIPLGNPSGSGISNFNSADVRPFAVAVHNGAVFVGVTYTAETSGRAADLRAYVLAFDPNQGAFRSYDAADGKFSNFSFSPVLIANLNYNRGAVDDPTPDQPNSGDEISANWLPWTSGFPTSLGQDGFPVHPSPWLTGIAFDGNNMVLGVRDRFGDQGGFETGNANTGDTDDEFSVIASGDILRAAPNTSGGWTLESNGSSGGVTTAGAGDGQGPGGGEYYYQDGSNQDGSFTVPQDATDGAVVQVNGFPTVASTGSDITTSFSGGIYTYFNANTPVAATTPGAVATKANAGTVDTQTELFETFDSSTFGDSNGLGGLAALPADGTVQVGDRVFEDTNGNGIQDAGEPGIAGVTVKLLLNGNQVDSTTTAADGSYLFDNLEPNTAYQISVATGQAALTGRTLAAAHQGTDGLLDSDATVSAGTATINLTTGDAGTSDHSLDFGFSATTKSTPPTLMLGDRVFKDANKNGVMDAGETGVSGVTVQLLDSTGATVLQSTTTDSAGKYTFTGLTAGTYDVRLPSSDFNAGGPLVGFTASPTTSAKPPDNVDNDSNGLTSGTLGSGGFIQSGPITLAAGTEPTNDGDSDPNTNLTIDFGVVPPAEPSTLTLGNLVWNDANGNGVFDSLESGIGGVTVQLLNSAGTVLQTTTTSSAGIYTFTGLAAGSYKVRLPASDFNTGGPLANFTNSSTGTTDPNATVNNNNDGKTVGTLGSGGDVESGLITLAAGAEPTNDGDSDPNTDLAVDFGLKPATVTATGGAAGLSGRAFLDFNNDGKLNGPDTGLSGVTVTLSGGNLSSPRTAKTDAQGVFQFTGLAAGTYRLTETAPTTPAGSDGKVTAGSAGGTTAVAQDAIGGITLTAGQMGSGYSFARVPQVSAGGTVFQDTNGNGKKDSNEPGVAGVTVTLSGTSVVSGTITPKSVTTDANGNYTLSGLTPGTYALTETPPTGYSPGTAQNGTPAASTVTATKFSGIDLASTAAAAGGFNFADVKTTSATSSTSLSGLVFNDVNNDGAQAASGEPGVAGVKVRLTGTNDLGQTVDTSATTGADGSFQFTNPRPGTYDLVETQPTGYVAGKVTAGTGGGTPATANKVTGIHITSGASATGYLFAEQARADLVLTQTPTTTAIDPGGDVTITYTLKNTGAATATAASVAVSFDGLTFVSASTPAAFSATTKTWTVGDLAAGASATIRVTYQARLAGTYDPSAHATTSATELKTTNNNSSSTISVGEVAAPTPTPEPTGPLGWLRTRLWFLSSTSLAWLGR
jgi:hypothetical protein